MRKTVTCFFALMMIAPAVFADAGTVSRLLPGGGTTSSNTSSTTATSTSSRGASGTTSNTSDDASRSATSRSATRVIPSRTTASRTSVQSNSGASNDTTTSVKSGNTTATPSRSATRGTTTTSRAGAATSVRENLDAAVHTSGRNARVSAAGVNNDPSVRRAGITLRPTTAEVGGRATIAGTNAQTGSNLGTTARSVGSRAAVTTRETLAEAKERLEQTSELNKSCQQQYNDCMDQFCAVIDSNQKRCSCSGNLSQYTKVETAVKDANNQLNDVAQRIRYVGLSADEIRAIMTATEAEQTLSGTRDTSETRSMLDDIEALIRDPSVSSSSTSTGTDNYSLLDMNLDFSDTSDLFSLDFLNTNSSSSISNLRGSDLYNAAKKRCNTILTQCTDAGATSQQIVANYDLAIDKDCISYEAGLTKMNETLVSNVRSANLMLQKARLSVLQNKNQYDAKECIGALDTCMTDDMVCGTDYVKCLDPTKRYIDENGNVVLGQPLSTISAFMEKFSNSEINKTKLQTAMNVGLNAAECQKDGSNDGSCIIKYLMQKIGTGQKATSGGLCRPVLDKCQRYTYNDSGTYEQYNDVVVNYIQRAMVNIKGAQEKIISDYASSCMTDVATCYNQQVSQINSWTSSASVSGIKNVMTGACYNVALTCGLAIHKCTGETDSYACKYTNSESESDDKKISSSGTKTNAILNSVSEMFYQSMLCPDNSTWTSTGKNTSDANGSFRAANKKSAYVNANCACNDGYTVWGGACILSCGTDECRNSSGTCTKMTTDNKYTKTTTASDTTVGNEMCKLQGT
ncbi:hypothetical protein HDR66_03505 [bacterium]|nr:hypothetical protein [bacterium]